MTQSQRTNVFISYSHADKQWLERLKVHLKPLEREGVIDLWSDEKIHAGSNWKEEIEKALREAMVAVLLISADFLASDFIDEDELPPLLAAAEKEDTVILSVIVSRSSFEENESLSKYQAVNPPNKPLLGMSRAEQDEVFYNLYKSISKILRAKEVNNIQKTSLESVEGLRPKKPKGENEDTKQPPTSGLEGSSTSKRKSISLRRLPAILVSVISGIVVVYIIFFSPIIKNIIKPFGTVQKVKLRSEAIDHEKYLAEYDVEIMIKNRGFFDSRLNKTGTGFPNQYAVQKGGMVVYDRASGLMWQQSGSEKEMKYGNAKAYLEALNSQNFAGYSDWRLPTPEEAMSLMEPTKMNGDLYIDIKFDKQQQWIWTSDLSGASGAWVVGFRLRWLRRRRLQQRWLCACCSLRTIMDYLML